MSKGLGKWERYVMEVVTCQDVPEDDKDEFEKGLKEYGFIYPVPVTVDMLVSLYNSTSESR